MAWQTHCHGKISIDIPITLQDTKRQQEEKKHDTKGEFQDNLNKDRNCNQ